LESLKERDHSENLGIWEDNIKMDLRETGFEGGLDSSSSRQGPVAGSCEHGNEPSGSIKDEDLLVYMSVLLTSQEGICSMEFVS
jgi:hypothetical protein